jgi:hypothetical protein
VSKEHATGGEHLVASGCEPAERPSTGGRGTKSCPAG